MSQYCAIVTSHLMWKAVISYQYHSCILCIDFVYDITGLVVRESLCCRWNVSDITGVPCVFDRLVALDETRRSVLKEDAAAIFPKSVSAQ